MTTIPAPSRTVAGPPFSSSRGLDEAVDRMRESAGCSPLVAALLRSLILMTIAAALLPCQALAQRRGFVGVGVGASQVSTDRPEVQGDTRFSFGARAGYGGSRVMVVLDYQRHGFGDEEPLVSDWPSGAPTPARVPQVLEADFLLLGAQIYLNRGLYVRPALGVGRQAFASYIHFTTPENGVTDSAYVGKEGLLAAGLSMGYDLKIHQRFSLGVEASLVLGSPVEGTGNRTVFGIQITPLLDF